MGVKENLIELTAHICRQVSLEQSCSNTLGPRRRPLISSLPRLPAAVR